MCSPRLLNTALRGHASYTYRCSKCFTPLAQIATQTQRAGRFHHAGKEGGGTACSQSASPPSRRGPGGDSDGSVPHRGQLGRSPAAVHKIPPAHLLCRTRCLAQANCRAHPGGTLILTWTDLPGSQPVPLSHRVTWHRMLKASDPFGDYLNSMYKSLFRMLN